MMAGNLNDVIFGALATQYLMQQIARAGIKQVAALPGKQATDWQNDER